MNTRFGMCDEAEKDRQTTKASQQRSAWLVHLFLAAVLALPAFGAHAAASLTTLYAFTGGNDGGYPEAALVQGSDGCFYGTTSGGGTNDLGTVFKISSNGMLTSLYSFSGTNDGRLPSAGLVQGSDGNFYGTTQWGGPYDQGTVFKITTNGVLTTLCSFSGGTNGGSVFAGLAQGSDGNFYGTTEVSVFKITPDGVLTTLHVLNSYLGSDGTRIFAGLVQASDGNFYGATTRGGANGLGTVFRITATGDLTTVYSFTNVASQYNSCYSTLVQGRDGYLYGTILGNGGSDNLGSVFKISTNGMLTTIYTFTQGNDGATPNGLLLGRDGNFYGTTAYTAFEITPSGTVTPLHVYAVETEGGYLQAGLVQGRDGSFYGTTQYGGPGGGGTVFRLTILPEFIAMTFTNATLNLTWSTQPGGSYQLQYTSDLSSTIWNNLGGPMTASGTTLNASDSILTGPRRFYRLAVVPAAL
jgi:uncharacterized repeat protein (TIGR03803 family)